jgi:predicted phage terminase large subunit-like protein
MDEASLMSVDVFNVLIGRLREGGEQGWLSATFTPKGRAHWTYNTFATNRADTAIFYARTRDNPFAPRQFDATLRAQYTSTLAAQELEGQFIDQGGTLYQRGWFQIIDQVREPLIATCRAWDLAGTVKDEAKANDPDFTAGVLMGKAANGTHYILDLRHTRGTPQQIQALVIRTAQADGWQVSIAMEQEPGSAGQFVVQDYLRRLPGFDFHGVRSTGSKADRAMPFAAQAEGGMVKMVRSPWNAEFLDEVELFPFGPHDDIVDAASLAFARLSWRQPEKTLTHPVIVPGRQWP